MKKSTRYGKRQLKKRGSKTFVEWVERRKTYSHNSHRSCKVSLRVAQLPCGCGPNHNSDLLVWERFDKQGRSMGWFCAMNHPNTKIHPEEIHGGHPFNHWR